MNQESDILLLIGKCRTERVVQGLLLVLGGEMLYIDQFLPALAGGVHPKQVILRIKSPAGDAWPFLRTWLCLAHEFSCLQAWGWDREEFLESLSIYTHFS